MKTILIFACLVTWVLAQDSKDYCKIDVKHVMCNNDGSFSPDCVEPQIIDINEFKQMILDKHNEFRNDIAGGKISGFPKAAYMSVMQWDEELAKLADYNTRKCDNKHDIRKTERFQYAGQNLALRSSTAPNLDPKSIINKLMDEWIKEKKDCPLKYIKSFPANYVGPAIGHFTAMVTANNTHVGCAAILYKKLNDGYPYRLQLTCNYAFANMKGRPIYEFTNNAVPECKTDDKYPYLCAAESKYNFEK